MMFDICKHMCVIVFFYLSEYDVKYCNVKNIAAQHYKSAYIENKKQCSVHGKEKNSEAHQRCGVEKKKNTIAHHRQKEKGLAKI